MTGIKILSDEDLVKVYNQAVEIKLETAFIDILLDEMISRGIERKSVAAV